jgi:hypothetical protein
MEENEFSKLEAEFNKLLKEDADLVEEKKRLENPKLDIGPDNKLPKISYDPNRNARIKEIIERREVIRPRIADLRIVLTLNRKDNNQPQ